MNMIHEKAIDFKSFEKKLYADVCRLGCELYAEALSAWDCELHKSRDRSVYRDKGKRRTTLKTLMGEVEIWRHVYTFVDDEGKNGTVYLLDNAMGRADSGFFSEAMIERIGTLACESTYRTTANEISSLTGQTVSHTAAWNIVQKLGERVDEREQVLSTLAAKNQGQGEIETKVLFEEMDGVWINLQGKDRKKTVSGGREMKLAIAYDGWVKTGKNRYSLTNKVACASFESIGKFRKRKEGVIASAYAIDEINVRVLNGDGANWIKKADFDTIYQLDPFHRNRAILHSAPDENSRDEMLKLLRSKRIDELLAYIDALANSVDDKEVEAKLRDLHMYFANNSEGLVAYNQRGLEIPKPPDHKEYRRLGAMESNVFTIIGNRMKGRRACWSINGGNNLARLLCLKYTGKLHKTISSLSSQMPEKYAKEVVTLSSIKVGSSVGKGWNGFNKSTILSSQKQLKDFGTIKPFSELSFY